MHLEKFVKHTAYQGINTAFGAELLCKGTGSDGDGRIIVQDFPGIPCLSSAGQVKAFELVSLHPVSKALLVAFLSGK